MSFSQASPFQPVTQDPPGELGRGGSRSSFLSAAHTEIPRRQPHAAARGEPCMCSQCSQCSHTPTENLLSQATDPRPGLVSSHLLESSILLTQIPRELGLLPRRFWLSSTPVGLITWEKRRGFQRAPSWFPALRSGEDFLCPIHLCFGDFPSSHGHPPQLLWLFQSPHSDDNRYSSAVEQVLEPSQQH